MRSLILLKVARAVLPVTTLFAIYLLLRGHDHPGGGFVAGLVSASAVVLQALAFGVEDTRRRLGPVLRTAPWLGIAVAGAVGLVGPLLAGLPLLTHFHAELPLPGHDPLHLSTTLVFDVGVYLVVVGATGTLAGLFAEGPE